jgi:uncharacterized membrane protein YqhA
MKIRRFERRVIVSSRFLTLAAVFGSLASSVLMFVLGLVNIYAAFRHGLWPPQSEAEAIIGTGAVINVIEGLDRFLIAIVLLYFAYGVYSLFVHPEQSEEELALPAWLRVGQIGQLKQVVAELIVVVLLVLFLRHALQAFSSHGNAMTWSQIATLLVLPVSTLMLAASLKLVEFHPKQRTPEAAEAADKKAGKSRAKAGD